ncbi:HEAT repeat domain-containing protein [Luteibacter aegosomatis]|uniref:HEAT repeat domain-containing protein n=1 Tax=Luteibacter aegosomatis TaxID=2911537 RepID=UPI001FF70342|nr:HEAT repeat domain-containing protein [Luteibacter aegosomatis]UPG87202.1 HEAT repeat domain-containing protein [Luteibacter aegosomatis]
MSYALANLPKLARFLRSLDEQIILSDYASFWGAVGEFDEFLRQDIWDVFFESAIGKMLEDASFKGGSDWDVHGFTVCDSDKFHFSVRSPKLPMVGRNVVDGPDSSARSIVSSMASPSVLSVVSDGPITFNRFRLPSNIDLDIFDPAIRLENLGSEDFEPWRRIDVHAPYETLEISTPHAGKCCIIELEMRASVSQRWEFDRETGEPVGAVLVSREAVIIRSMLEEISRFKYVEALGEVLGLLDHRDFNVRWMAVKCACALDRDSGVAALRRCLNDRHPYIRNASLSTLNAIGG